MKMMMQTIKNETFILSYDADLRQYEITVIRNECHEDERDYYTNDLDDALDMMAIFAREAILGGRCLADS